MSSIWNKNIALFCNRFPQLAKNLGIDEKTPEPTDEEIPYKIETAKSGFPTATYNGVYLHSKYAPEKVTSRASVTAGVSVGEISTRSLRSLSLSKGSKRRSFERPVEPQEALTFLFLGIGLGYSVIETAKNHPAANLIIAEPLPIFFFTALRFLDFEAFFKCENCIVALGAKENDVMTILENYGGSKNCTVVAQKQQIQHATLYFENIKDLIARNIKKDKINQWTLEKFGKLWKRNEERNLENYKKCRGVAELFASGTSTGSVIGGVAEVSTRSSDRSFERALEAPQSVLILAAGPTLDEILPHLKKLQEKMTIICVDTALRAALRAGCEPDFILLLDPQYYAYRHIAALSSKSSIFVTDLLAYPAAYRFDCKEIFVCTTFSPFENEIEKNAGVKGHLEAGGSVATSAWDFAKHLGAKKIYFAGLDLGFPEKQTHIKGSTFEEATHRKSNRLSPAETSNIALLFGANMKTARSYNGNEILTDDRMQLFAYWFEANIENAKSENPDLRTFTLSEKSLKIPGFEVAKIEELL